MNPSADWSFKKKVSFRFFFLFFILYIFFNPNGFLPYSDDAYNFYITPFHTIIPWLGKHILHLSYDITVFTNGSGDTTYDYVTMFFIVIISIAGCIIWSICDGKRRSYDNLYYWLTVIVRYYLAFTMFSYGFIKIFKLQFPFPDAGRMTETYGESSPMGLAWTFMGYSQGYNYFTGFGEVLSGLLLLFRRTTTIGAFVSFVVAANVMAINYCFDVPVKLLSTMLVLMSLFLVAKDLKRLYNFLVLNQTTSLPVLRTPKFKKHWVNITAATFKYLLIAFVLFINISNDYGALAQYGDNVPKPPLYGFYNVETFIINHDTLPPLTSDSIRWNKLVISYSGFAKLKMMNGDDKYYSFQPDTATKQLTMYAYSDTIHYSYLTYSLPQKNILLLQGTWLGDSIYIRLKNDTSGFPLATRGFHWINEYPYNR
jgi:hypothetical protein